MKSVTPDMTLVGGPWFAILGAPLFHVAGGDGPAHLTPQEEAVLSRLLLSAGQPVPVAELITAVWAGQGDVLSARNGIQGLVSRLLKLLEPDRPARAPGQVLVSSGSAYTLEIPSTCLDVGVFDALVWHARTALRRRPRQAALLLEEALALWRGPLLGGADLAKPFLPAYERRRTDALVDLSRAWLELAEYEAVVTTLAPELATGSIDERLHGYLMLALHGSGQSAEALAAFRDAVRRLGTPGPPLRELAAQIAGDCAPLTYGEPFARHFEEGPSIPAPGFLVAVVSGPGTGDEPRGPEGPATLIVRHGGHPAPVRPGRTLGVFAAGDDAFRAAADLAELGGGKRVAVHRGALVVVGSEHAGPALARAWMLAASTNPGQALVSTEAVAATDDAPPAGLSLVDLGKHQLSDLAPRARVHQLHRAPVPFPGLRSLDPRAHNLPTQRTRLIGRFDERNDVAHALCGGRPVTVTGAIGCGKTRLALQVAADVLGCFGHGARYVTLADLDEGDDVPTAVARGIGLDDPGGGIPALEAILGSLADRELLLVLDDCERVARAVSELVAVVHEDCPNVRVLATSRCPLGFAAELVWALAPLSLGGDDGGDDGADGPSDRRRDARMLLLERSGRLARPSPLSERELESADEICTMLGGLPLAIELVARRVAQAGLERVAPLLARDFATNSLDLLHSDDADGPARHRTLEAALDRSCQLLPSEARALFRRLGVFRGTFGAAMVGRVATCAPGRVNALLLRLVEASLVEPAAAFTADDDEPQFHLLKPIRAYAAAGLDRRQEADGARTSHALAYGQLAAEAEPELFGPDELVWLDRLEAEADNLRAAMDWDVEGGEGERALRCVGALWMWFFGRGRLAEGREYAQRALAASREPSRARARALLVEAHLAWWQADYADTVAASHEMLECAAATGDRWAEASGNLGLAAAAMFTAPDLDSTLVPLHAALARYRELDARWDLGHALQLLAGTHWQCAEYEAAEAAFGEAEAIFADLGHRSMLASVTRGRGLMLALLGRDGGEQACRRALELTEALGCPAGSAQALCFLGAAAQYREDHDAAAAQYSRALRIAHGAEELWTTCMAMQGLAVAACARDDTETAVRLLARAEALAADTGYRPAPRERQLIAEAAAAAREALDSQEVWEAEREGRAARLDHAVAEALMSATGSG